MHATLTQAVLYLVGSHLLHSAVWGGKEKSFVLAAQKYFNHVDLWLVRSESHINLLVRTFSLRKSH